jgi:opacity protein-like surface antigen
MTTKRFLAVLVSLLILSALCQAAKLREIILSFGAGYSLGLDSTLKKNEIFYTDQIYFKEQTRMKECLNLSLQYFFTPAFGAQLELNHQEASYFSHLEWYGLLVQDWSSPTGYRYIEINHIEEPYWERWGISSVGLYVIAPWRKRINQRLYPYISGGIGLYLLSGDKDKVLDRFRLGPRKTQTKYKVSGGLKYSLNSKLNLNLRIFCEMLRRYRGAGIYVIYNGPDQFDLDWYLSEGKIGRVGRSIIGTYSYGGIDINLEFKL